MKVENSGFPLSHTLKLSQEQALCFFIPPPIPSSSAAAYSAYFSMIAGDALFSELWLILAVINLWSIDTWT